MEDQFSKLTNGKFGCGYKWAWSTIFLQQGSSSSCHRTMQDFFDEQTVQQFHNSPLKLQSRKAMLDGQWPGHGCEYCKNIEAAGGISDRQQINKKFQGLIVPKELLTDSTAINVSPTMIELHFSNLCNMSCIYCNQRFSSVWEQENLKHGNIFADTEFLLNHSATGRMIDSFFDWLHYNIGNLVKINILGGEPFYQSEFYRFIDFLAEHPNPNLDITVFSNLKVNENKFSSALKRLETFVKSNIVKSVEIVASLDCWGPEQEYVRTGLSLQQWEDNFALLVNNFQDIEVQIHGTISSLTIKTIPDLLNKINFYNSMRSKHPISYSNNILVHPNCLQPGIFPLGFFDDDFNKILPLIQNQAEHDEMQGYFKTINNTDYNPQLIIELKQYLDTLDIRRHTNWKTVFPWLDQFDVDKHHS